MRRGEARTETYSCYVGKFSAETLTGSMHWPALNLGVFAEDVLEPWDESWEVMKDFALEYLYAIIETCSGLEVVCVIILLERDVLALYTGISDEDVERLDV